MSENENNVDFDPFGSEADVVPSANAAGNDDILDDINLGDDDLDDLFDGADFAMEEEDSGEEIRVRDAGAIYENPLDVGLKDGMWVAIRLYDVALAEKHVPRLSSKVCLAVETLPDGRKRVHVPYDKVEERLRAGAVEVIREQPLPYFVGMANHVAPEFGQRRYPYEIGVPALTIKTAYHRPQNSGRTGFPNKNGYSLRKATGATEKGEKVSLETMPEIASRMEDKIVMAQISLSTKQRTRPRTDENDQPISILVNPEDATPITVVALESQKVEGEDPAPTQYLLNDGSGQEWDGDPRLLTPISGQEYAIIDNGENSAPLMESYPKTTDYINPPFLPVPDRAVKVEMVEPKKVTVEVPGEFDDQGKPLTKTEEEPVFIEGEITWGTVGAIAQGKVPGTPVDVLLKNGKTITAIWLGTQWVEVAPDGGKSGGLDEFAGVQSL